MAGGAVSTAYAVQCLLAELLARPGSRGALKVCEKRLQVALYTRQCNTSGICELQHVGLYESASPDHQRKQLMPHLPTWPFAAVPG